MIQNIIFDIGNVLVTFDPYTYFLKYFKEETKTRTLCELMFSHEAWSQYDAGILLRKDLYRSIIRRIHSIMKKWIIC